MDMSAFAEEFEDCGGTSTVAVTKKLGDDLRDVIRRYKNWKEWMHGLSPAPIRKALAGIPVQYGTRSRIAQGIKDIREYERKIAEGTMAGCLLQKRARPIWEART